MKRASPLPLANLGLSENALLHRAVAEWLMAGNGARPCSCSAVEAHAQRWYVVLRGGRGPSDRPMAVYRVRDDGGLQRIRRWPASIEA